MSTLEKGKSLEQEVGDLLNLKGVRFLTSEKILGNKKIDLYFEKEEFKSRIRYAVECKNYMSPLTQQHMELIVAGYRTLLDANKIDRVLIVTTRGLAPGPQTLVDDSKEFSHMTLNELRNSIIDFSGYLNGLSMRFASDEVFNYFVAPQGIGEDAKGSPITTGENQKYADLISLIRENINQSNKPIVVLGAYGIGKTTLAMRLFQEFYQIWKNDPGRPIPIFISLSRMTHEQRIEGLLGHIFTSESPAAGYNFDIFCRMNEMGSFILLLDGFDEMRHMLTWDDFLYNLQQISILVRPNPRTILLGRPTAFMEQAEFDVAIRGSQQRPDLLNLTSGTLAAYREFEISPLNDTQIRSFIDAFFAWKKNRKEESYNIYEKKKVNSLVFSKSSPHIMDIAKRPVQLKMLLEILPALSARLDSITERTLYSIFVDELVRRERQKGARRRFSSSDRRIFSQRIAWWLWLKGGESSATSKQVPRGIFKAFCKELDDPEVVRRDLITSSFLSTVQGEFIHFPHRSIQEFLVSEHLKQILANGETFLAEMTNIARLPQDVFTREVIDFLAPELTGDNVDALCDYLNLTKSIPLYIFDLFSSKQEDLLYVMQRFRRTGDPICGIALTTAALRAGLVGEQYPKIIVQEIVDELLQQIQHKSAYYRREQTRATVKSTKAFDEAGRVLVREAMLYLALVLIISSRYGDNFEGLLASSLQAFDGFTYTIAIVGKAGGKRAPGKESRETHLDLEALDLIRRLKTNSPPSDISWIYKFLRSSIIESPFVREWVLGETIAVQDFKLRRKLSDAVILRCPNYDAARQIQAP